MINKNTTTKAATPPSHSDKRRNAMKKLKHVIPVAENEITNIAHVPSSVKWRRHERHWVDNIGVFIFGALYICFVWISISIISQAHLRFESVFASRIVSENYRNDVASCCREADNIIYISDRHTHSHSSLCHRMNETSARRMQSSIGNFEGDEGIFQAFETRPEIVVSQIFATCILSLVWIVMLQRFAKITVFAIEWTKLFISLSLSLILASSGNLLGLIGVIFTGWMAHFLFRRRKDDLEHAASMIRHATAAFNENRQLIIGLVFVKMLYITQVCAFILIFIASFEVVDVVRRDNAYIQTTYIDENFTETNVSTVETTVTELSCEFEQKPFVGLQVFFLCIAFIFTVMIFDKIRLCIVALTIGSWRFHPDSKPSFLQALRTSLTTSFGCLSSAAILTSVSELLQRRNFKYSWLFCIGPQALCLIPLQCLMCLCSCVAVIVRLCTRFSVILHAFTGHSLFVSATKCHAIMSRRFVGGFITDFSSKSALSTGAHVLTLMLTFLAWAWMDAAFECNTLVNAGWVLLPWVLVMIIAFSAPLLGLFGILAINHIVLINGEEGSSSHASYWVPPLAALFLGCISKLFFDYVGGIIKDSVDVLFLCFAMDEDNGIIRNHGDNDFDAMVRQMPDFIVATPLSVIDPESPVVTGVVVGELPPEAEVNIGAYGHNFENIKKESKKGKEMEDDLSWIIAITRKDLN